MPSAKIFEFIPITPPPRKGCTFHDLYGSNFMSKNDALDPSSLQAGHLKQRDIAAWLSCSTRTVREYRDSGVIPHEAFDPNGRVNPAIAIPAVIQNLRDLHQQKIAHAPEGKEALDPTYEKAALAKQQRLKTEEETKLKKVAVSQAEGRVVDREAVTLALSSIIASAKNRLIALPANLGSKLHGLNGRDMQIIDDVVHDTLNQLADDLPRAVELLIEKVPK